MDEKKYIDIFNIITFLYSFGNTAQRVLRPLMLNLKEPRL